MKTRYTVAFAAFGAFLTGYEYKQKAEQEMRWLEQCTAYKQIPSCHFTGPMAEDYKTFGNCIYINNYADLCLRSTTQVYFPYRLQPVYSDKDTGPDCLANQKKYYDYFGIPASSACDESRDNTSEEPIYNTRITNSLVKFYAKDFIEWEARKGQLIGAALSIIACSFFSRKKPEIKKQRKSHEPSRFLGKNKQSSDHNLDLHAREYGFVGCEVESDGNCFYHAIAHQLNKGNKKRREPYTPSTLRELASNFIMENASYYSSFLTKEDKSIEDFVRKNRKSGEFADHIYIDALARALGRTIVIIRSDNGIPNVFKQKSGNKNGSPIYLGYDLEAEHYTSLVRSNRFLPKMRIETLIDKSPFLTELHTYQFLDDLRY